MSGADTKKAKYNKKHRISKKIRSKMKFVTIILILACLAFSIGWIKNTDHSIDNPLDRTIHELKQKASLNSFDNDEIITEEDEEEEEDDSEIDENEVVHNTRTDTHLEKDKGTKSDDSKLQVDMKLKL